MTIRKGLSIKFQEAFVLYLAVEFKMNDKNIIVSSKKINFTLESTDSNMENAQKEFAEAIIVLINLYIENGTLFKVFKIWGIKQQEHHEAIAQVKKEITDNEKKLESKLEDSVFYDMDLILLNGQKTFLSEPCLTWN